MNAKATVKPAPKNAEYAESEVSGKALYELARAFYDGRILHPVGSKLYFDEGTAPSGSHLVEGDVVSPEPPTDED